MSLVSWIGSRRERRGERASWRRIRPLLSAGIASSLRPGMPGRIRSLRAVLRRDSGATPALRGPGVDSCNDDSIVPPRAGMAPARGAPPRHRRLAADLRPPLDAVRPRAGGDPAPRRRGAAHMGRLPRHQGLERRPDAAVLRRPDRAGSTPSPRSRAHRGVHRGNEPRGARLLPRSRPAPLRESHGAVALGPARLDALGRALLAPDLGARPPVPAREPLPPPSF
jgi:hypothetical protein